jgi:AraC family transcriptional regulator, regulatory protein of adaptative response / methylated-DNA-[protein]-cysteine methyltransferase
MTPFDSVMTSLPIETAFGTFLASYTDRGLAELNFPSEAKSPRPANITAAKQIAEWHRATVVALQQALAAEPITNLPPFDLRHGTAFQQQVWNELRKIRVGVTISYGDLAAAIGNPGATRAVGSACGANRIPVLIPCHRVLASGGRLGGFSAGLDWKRRLLAIEKPPDAILKG